MDQSIPGEVRVSDHAVLRYVERVCGLDVEVFRAEILAICGDAARVGASAVKKDGFFYPIRGGTVLSCVATERALHSRDWGAGS